MANYLLVYHGGSMPEGEAEQKSVMQAWTDWFATLGPGLIDGGNPASQTRTIAADVPALITQLKEWATHA